MKPIELDPSDLRPVAEYINESFVGDLTSVTHDLNRAVYLLHFVNEKDAAKNEVLDVSFSLQQLSNSFFQCHIRRGKE